jgi:hypothetical protein
MSPLLPGIIASGISGHLTPPWSPEGGYDSLATVTVPSGGAASITFAGVPSGYKHLQIRGIGRAATGQSATSLADMFMRINGDTGSNYARHRLLGDGSSALAGATSSQTQIPWTAVFPRSTAASNLFGSFVLDILDYGNVSKYKTFRFLGGADINGTGGTIGFQSGLWMSTSAITSMTFTFETDSNSNPSAQFSQLALYGVK